MVKSIISELLMYNDNLYLKLNQNGAYFEGLYKDHIAPLTISNTLKKVPKYTAKSQ